MLAMLYDAGRSASTSWNFPDARHQPVRDWPKHLPRSRLGTRRVCSRDRLSTAVATSVSERSMDFDAGQDHRLAACSQPWPHPLGAWIHDHVGSRRHLPIHSGWGRVSVSARQLSRAVSRTSSSAARRSAVSEGQESNGMARSGSPRSSSADSGPWRRELCAVNRGRSALYCGNDRKARCLTCA